MDKTERPSKNLLTSVFSVYFCIDGHRTGVYEIHPETVIAGLTRNLLNEKDTPSRTGDGGCSSAMTVKVKGRTAQSKVLSQKQNAY